MDANNPNKISMEPIQNKVHDLFARQRAFQENNSIDYSQRIATLKNLKNVIIQNEKLILTALSTDLRKPPVESYTSEYISLVKEIRCIIHNLKKWLKPTTYPSPFYMKPGKYYSTRNPHGIVLIISPWNYPINLSLIPLMYAIAGGNSVILKPSEISPASSDLLMNIITNNFNKSIMAVIEGGADVVHRCLQERPSFVFFTGSPGVGAKIYQNAAKLGIPVALELGGKNPCIVDTDKDLTTVAKRICWAKFFNAGQTCVAPDYCLVKKSILPQFLGSLTKSIDKFYGKQKEGNRDFGRIINKKHFDRIIAMITKDVIHSGGAAQKDDHFIEPTILTLDTTDHPSMKEEIFGPVLPVLSYRDNDQIIKTIQTFPVPLILYCFTESNHLKQRLIKETMSGNICFNLTLHRMLLHEMPFGGVKDSGFGRYHGIEGLKTFTYLRSIAEFNGFTDVRMVYPPYTHKLRILRKIGKFFF